MNIAGLSDVLIATCGTDGTDGPTELAGGIIDSSITERAKEKGLDLLESLLSHDASTILSRLSDAIITGHTGTNVNSLYVMLAR